jgi:hypothetical protein
MFFIKIGRSRMSSCRNVGCVLSEGGSFIVSTPAGVSASQSCVMLELNAELVTGAQAARDIKNIIVNARKKKRG